MPEAMNMPLELAEPEPEQTAKKGFFKKLFMKIGERVGNVKQTELSKEYLDAVNRVDAYHAVVQEVCKQCCRMIQQNPQHFAAAENMHVQSPKGKDPFEELCQYLKPAIKELPKPEPITAARESCKRLALFHRQMQDDVRKAMHFLRTFVNVDYPAFEEERQKLLKVRQQMDRARADYEIGPTEGKKYSYGMAKQQFLEQTDKVMQMVTDINKKKEDHVTDLIVILRAMHKYHHQSMLECQSLRPQRAILGEPTRYDLL
ncbi:unnamed protein product [Bursaphelenchus xylophilus]|nr:unnamed protein product [Bursaphelenchus xylophilus]CAG9128747.1 unnamed protein product [Bursaphelenchus xylophilus]